MWKWTCELEDKLTDQDNIAFNETVSVAKPIENFEITVYSILWLLSVVGLSGIKKKQAADCTMEKT